MNRRPARAKPLAWLLPLLVLALGTPAPGAEDEALEALEALKEKMAWEARQLKRLSAMVRIPEGEFFMGAENTHPNESPVHRVFVSAFDLDQYEVTQLQYLSVMGTNPSYFNKCLLCPVEKVDFHRAEEYCRKVGKRLPTEAEWEKAARGGRLGPYYWGNDLIDPYAWYGNNAGGQTRPVGTREPNPLGLHDMAGNVWEWVADWYAPDYYERSPYRDPRGPEKGATRVIRGGGWGNPPELLTHSYRDHRDPDTHYINVGFRCARDAS